MDWANTIRVVLFDAELAAACQTLFQRIVNATVQAPRARPSGLAVAHGVSLMTSASRAMD